MGEPGVLIARDDGVIVVPNAVPISPAFVRRVDALCDAAGAPQTRAQNNNRPGDAAGQGGDP